MQVKVIDILFFLLFFVFFWWGWVWERKGMDVVLGCINEGMGVLNNINHTSEIVVQTSNYNNVWFIHPMMVL